MVFLTYCFINTFHIGSMLVRTIHDVKLSGAGSMQESKDFELEELVNTDEWRNRGVVDFIITTLRLWILGPI